MTPLIIYGDFNCPFSALASARADVLIADGTQIEWRAVQHDPTIPVGGEPVAGDSAIGLSTEVATVLEQNEHDAERIHLAVPPVRSNTAAASAAFAAATNDDDDLRRRLFAAVWTDGRNLGDPTELEGLGGVARAVTIARRWQDKFDALPRPVTPTLILADGYVSRGLGALARLGKLVAAIEHGSMPDDKQ